MSVMYIKAEIFHIEKDEIQDNSRYLETNFETFCKYTTFSLVYPFDMSIACMISQDGKSRYFLGLDMCYHSKIYYPKGYKVFLKLENEETITLSNIYDISERDNYVQRFGLGDIRYHIRPYFELTEETQEKLLKNKVIKLRIQSDWGYDNASLKNPYIDIPNKKYKAFQTFEFSYYYLNATKTILQRIIGEDSSTLDNNKTILLEDF